jgi:hypothetical protein
MELVEASEQAIARSDQTIHCLSGLLIGFSVKHNRNEQLAAQN